MARSLRSLATLLTTFALVSLTLVTARANEFSASPVRVSGIVVHDATETLRDFCHEQDGKLFFQLPNGAQWELVTSTTDPSITNPGDGAFHPYETREIDAALAQVRFPLENVSAEIFVLPYPRRVSLESAAGRGLILLSPGVRPLSREHQHAEFVHELGHVVQYALFPDADANGWAAYARMRGIDDPRFNASAPHADRPHEIWAEDFRALFGGASATSNGTIENASLSYPTQVAGLDRFMASLAANAATAGSARLMAAPLARGAVSFSRFGTRAAVLDVFDA